MLTFFFMFTPIEMGEDVTHFESTMILFKGGVGGSLTHGNRKQAPALPDRWSPGVTVLKVVILLQSNIVSSHSMVGAAGGLVVGTG